MKIKMAEEELTIKSLTMMLLMMMLCVGTSLQQTSGLSYPRPRLLQVFIYVSMIMLKMIKMMSMIMMRM